MSHRPRNGWVHAQRDLLPFLSPILPPDPLTIFHLPRPKETSATSVEPQTQSPSLPSSIQTSSPLTTSSSVSSRSSASTTTNPSSSTSSSATSSTSSISTITTASSSSSAAESATSSPIVPASPAPATAAISESIIITTSNGQVLTLTSFVNEHAAATSIASSTSAPASPSFLQNKVLSGVVFALVGLLGLTAILAAAIFTVRRRRHKKLLKEAISFDPALVDEYVADKDRSEAVGFGRPGGDGYGHDGGTAMAYPFGMGRGYGVTDGGVRVPRQPEWGRGYAVADGGVRGTPQLERALSPQGQVHDATGDVLHQPPGHGEGIGWTPDPTPFMPSRPDTHYSIGDLGGATNRVLKIANE